MNLHSLKNTTGAKSSRKRLGRGVASGLGKTSGRGHKGQYARSGHKHKLGFEGGQMRLIRRIPKRGFTNISRKEFLPVNVAELNIFAVGSEVTPDLMKSKGLANGGADGIKILGTGTITKKLTVKAHKFSVEAKAKIEAAGGVCEIVT
ncbi:MAG: 50S ribosomal protein L15 [bacterium]